MGVKQGISISQQLRQRQEQKLSPQQIQFIKLLTKTTLALEQRVKDELQDNPILEQEGSVESEESLSDIDEDEGDQDDPFDDIDVWETLYESADDLYGHKAQVDSREEVLREIPTPYDATLSERLRGQIGLAGLEGVERAIANQIIGSIDDDGRLRRELYKIADDIAFDSHEDVSETLVEQVLMTVQRFDPIGIAARTLQECLLIQSEALPEQVPYRDLAIAVLTDHYKAFTMKHFDDIIGRLRVSEDDLRDAIQLIQRFDPRPGYADAEGTAAYIVPDFEVRRSEDTLTVIVNRRNLPPLRISPTYLRMLEEGQRTGKQDAQTKKFLRQKFEAATWFINSVRQRNDTMSRVMSAIVEVQQDFFLLGRGHLKPMVLKDIAEIVRMDVSTISRVVKDKYVQTEFGILALKYFFSEGVETTTGERVSNREVKAIIEHIIADEDKRKPLSDQKITSLLADQKFIIARRTVTKYRESLDLPVARLRKEI